MLNSVEFQNFRALRDATLPLQRMTLIVGPNGSGKSTALMGLQAFNQQKGPFHLRLQHGDVASSNSSSGEVRLTLRFTDPIGGAEAAIGRWSPSAVMAITSLLPNGRTIGAEAVSNRLNRIRMYTFDARALAAPVQVQQGVELGPRGEGLVY
jgi:predicted ATP-dependent endonuclease of OLD family